MKKPTPTATFKKFRKSMRAAIDVRPGGAQSYYGPWGNLKAYRLALDSAADTLVEITCVRKNHADVDAAHKMLNDLSGSCDAYATPRMHVVKRWKKAIKTQRLTLTPYAASVFARFKF